VSRIVRFALVRVVRLTLSSITPICDLFRRGISCDERALGLEIMQAACPVVCCCLRYYLLHGGQYRGERKGLRFQDDMTLKSRARVDENGVGAPCVKKIMGFGFLTRLIVDIPDDIFATCSSAPVGPIKTVVGTGRDSDGGGSQRRVACRGQCRQKREQSLTRGMMSLILLEEDCKTLRKLSWVE